MKRNVRACVATLIMLFAACVAGAAITLPLAADAPAAVVRINTPTGHGSGVHIGSGLFLTAAHVVRGDETYDVTLGDGAKFSAEVLWTSESYDVALLRVADLGLPMPQAAGIECGPAMIGEQVYAVGNPFDLGVTTTHGKVAGLDPGKSRWKEAIVMDMTVGAGMSGGPVYSLAGRLRGIVVGAFGQLSSLSFVVPSSTICKLMARV